MLARIYAPTKSAMQSGKGKTGNWILKYEGSLPKRIEPLMGYTSSSDMHSQVRLEFKSKEDAIRYAQSVQIAYKIFEPKSPKRTNVSYSDNFKFDRKTPWTH